MLTSKKQEWILQMIKGPDIAPVINQPGHYTSKSTITITVNEHQVTIRPTDILNLSNPEYLIVHKDGSECEVPWDRISCLDFEEQEIPNAGDRRRPVAVSSHRVLSYPLGKKVV
jgi:hypothetical protein